MKNTERAVAKNAQCPSTPLCWSCMLMLLRSEINHQQQSPILPLPWVTEHLKSWGSSPLFSHWVSRVANFCHILPGIFKHLYQHFKTGIFHTKIFIFHFSCQIRRLFYGSKSWRGSPLEMWGLELLCFLWPWGCGSVSVSLAWTLLCFLQQRGISLCLYLSLRWGNEIHTHMRVRTRARTHTPDQGQQSSLEKSSLLRTLEVFTILCMLLCLLLSIAFHRVQPFTGPSD